MLVKIRSYQRRYRHYDRNGGYNSSFTISASAGARRNHLDLNTFDSVVVIPPIPSTKSLLRMSVAVNQFEQGGSFLKNVKVLSALRACSTVLPSAWCRRRYHLKITNGCSLNGSTRRIVGEVYASLVGLRTITAEQYVRETVSRDVQLQRVVAIGETPA